ncbi:MAG TPA: indole-3-glycerol phosphate synthase TrpC [Bacteroidales bacterium]|nr:indole-3-glycerol phosphate synthase TrpC [Bacteroidales bacterium]
MNILADIIANKIEEVKLVSERIPLADLKRKDYFSRSPVSLSDYLLDTNKSGIIAEYKRKSPSKGEINKAATVAEVTQGYSRSGASALSVLTDNKYFGGSLSDLSEARKYNNLPLLRKDFIISEYQVFESKAIGADAVLLIAAVLESNRLRDLARLAQSLGLEVLMEIHNATELEKVNGYVDIIGVNNRNLDTFIVDLNTSIELAKIIPGDFIRISESGISSPESIALLRKSGYKGFLIGERFMTSDDPVKAFSDFVKSIG